MKTFKHILKLIEEQNLTTAELQLTSIGEIELPAAEQHYLWGLLFVKRSDWKQAQTHFLHAVALDPQSPARETLEMLTNIYDYHYKDNLNP